MSFFASDCLGIHRVRLVINHTTPNSFLLNAVVMTSLLVLTPSFSKTLVCLD